MDKLDYFEARLNRLERVLGLKRPDLFMCAACQELVMAGCAREGCTVAALLEQRAQGPVEAAEAPVSDDRPDPGPDTGANSETALETLAEALGGSAEGVREVAGLDEPERSPRVAGPGDYGAAEGNPLARLAGGEGYEPE